MNDIQFSVLGCDPVPKERPRTVQRGGKVITFTPQRTRDWEDRVAQVGRLYVPEPQDGYWEVTLVFYRKSGRKVDIDNLSKAVLDGLNGVIWMDDRQIVRLTLSKLRVRSEAEAGVVVQAWRIEDVDEELAYG